MMLGMPSRVILNAELSFQETRHFPHVVYNLIAGCSLLNRNSMDSDGQQN